MVEAAADPEVREAAVPYSLANPARNVLYLVFDDLRPDLSFYGADWMDTPHLQRLADSGTAFDRAYSQETVCSPSRMSFTTGRRPNTTQAWNFLNHIRQAECPSTAPGVLLSGTPLPGTRHRNGISFMGLKPGASGGSAQCCTDCFASPGCAGWQLRNRTCTLFSAVHGGSRAPCDNDGVESVCISGEGGGMRLPRWTTLPQHLREQGWLTLGVGKYFHDTNNGLGVLGDARYPAGGGLPPEADPTSWSNVSAQNRELKPLQQTYGHHLQLFKGSAYTGGEGHGYVDAMDGCSGDITVKVELCSAELYAEEAFAPTPVLSSRASVCLSAHECGPASRGQARRRLERGEQDGDAAVRLHRVRRRQAEAALRRGQPRRHRAGLLPRRRHPPPPPLVARAAGVHRHVRARRPPAPPVPRRRRHRPLRRHRQHSCFVPSPSQVPSA